MAGILKTLEELLEDMGMKNVHVTRGKPYDSKITPESLRGHSHKYTVLLKLRKGLDGGDLGYKFIRLLNYTNRNKTFDAETDVGFQKIHKSELRAWIWQYKEE